MESVVAARLALVIKIESAARGWLGGGGHVLSGDAGVPQTNLAVASSWSFGNPKLEYRNPKQIQKFK
jgi:hypothetical protein